MLRPLAVNYTLSMKEALKALVLLMMIANSYCYDFNDYILEFKREYATQEEFNFRKSIFDKNYALIVEGNKESGKGLLGVTIWTDRTGEEYTNSLSIAPP